jgi:hypothetical protein
LSPDIVDSAIRDHSVSEYSLTRRFAELPFDWSNQRDALGSLKKDIASRTRLSGLDTTRNYRGRKVITNTIERAKQVRSEVQEKNRPAEASLSEQKS